MSVRLWQAHQNDCLCPRQTAFLSMDKVGKSDTDIGTYSRFLLHIARSSMRSAFVPVKSVGSNTQLALGVTEN